MLIEKFVFCRIARRVEKSNIMLLDDHQLLRIANKDKTKSNKISIAG
jgi:hypothetical protein